MKMRQSTRFVSWDSPRRVTFSCFFTRPFLESEALPEDEARSTGNNDDVSGQIFNEGVSFYREKTVKQAIILIE